MSAGKHPVRKLKRVQILLAADAGANDEDIPIRVGARGSTVYRTKRRFVLGNLEAALSEEPAAGASRKLSGREEALPSAFSKRMEDDGAGLVVCDPDALGASRLR
jgi:Winged helix-turn helix